MGISGEAWPLSLTLKVCQLAESEKSLSMVPLIVPTSTQAPKLFFP